MKLFKKSLFALVVCSIFIAGLFSSNIYFVQFDKKPDLKVGQNVTFKNFTIGKIQEITLTDDNYIVMKIKIKDKYEDRIVETGVFYAEEEKLKYIILDEKGPDVKKGKYFLGFENKYKYYIWKTKSWLKDGVKAIREKINENKEKI